MTQNKVLTIVYIHVYTHAYLVLILQCQEKQVRVCFLLTQHQIIMRNLLARARIAEMACVDDNGETLRHRATQKV